jgi:hypothetical protein
MTSVSISDQSPISSHRHSALVARGRHPISVVLSVVAGLLVASSGAIHFYLWDIAYRHVAKLGPLFLLQGISAVVVALALIGLRWGIVLVAAMGLMVGTLIGFILVLTTGLFGFKLGFVSGWAYLTVVAECAAVVVLAAAGTLLWRETA